MSQPSDTPLALMGTPLQEIEEEFVSVAEMQRKIMPEPNLIRRFGEAHIYGGTLPIEWVGGDFYDFIDMSRFDIEGRIGIVIADASGHGLSAAMLVRDFNTALYTGISFESHYVKDTTSLLFRKLNRRIYRSTLNNQYLSAFYAELTLQGRLRYVNAGHLPPLLFHPDGHIEHLEQAGTVLGAFLDPPTPYSTGETRLDPGALLMAYTDGIIEAANPEGEEYGLPRLIEAIQRNRSRSVRDIFSVVMGEVDLFTGTKRQSDDRTLIVIGREREQPQRSENAQVS